MYVVRFRKCLSKLRIIPSRNKHLFIFEIQVIEIRTKSRKTACCETYTPKNVSDSSDTCQDTVSWLQSSVRFLLINLSSSICRVRIPNSNFLIPLFHTGHESPESPQIDFFLFIWGGGGGGEIREVSLNLFLQ